jgi:MFS family permease
MGAMQMQMMVRGFLVYDITGSAALLGLVSAGSAAPILTLALFGGAVADRVERKRLIQVGQATVGILALLIGIAIATDYIEWYHLMIASLIQGTSWSFLMPARQALIPELVGKNRLTNALALNAAGMSIMTMLAPAVAGVLYTIIGPDNVYFLISGLGFTAFLFTTHLPKTGRVDKVISSTMARDIVAGLAYIRRKSLVLVLLVMGLSTTLLANPFRFIMPVFIVDIYQRDADSMGLMMAVMGAGTLVGALFVASLGQWRRGLLLLGGGFLSGVALLLVAAVPLYYAGVAIMLLLGLGDAARRTLNQSLIMEQVEDQYRGRVMSVFMMEHGLMPLGVVPLGIAIEALGGQVAVGILSGLLLVTVSTIYLTRKDLRDLP